MIEQSLPQTPEERYRYYAFEGMAPINQEIVKNMRIDIRRIKNTLPINGPSRYNAMIFTSLEKAAMWLGKVLGNIGEQYPYEKGVAGPIADDTKEVMEFPDNTSASEKIYYLRDFLGLLCRQIAVWSVTPKEYNNAAKEFELAMALSNAYTHLAEARMDLGMELSSILQQEKLTQK